MRGVGGKRLRHSLAESVHDGAVLVDEFVQFGRVCARASQQCSQARDSLMQLKTTRPALGSLCGNLPPVAVF